MRPDTNAVATINSDELYQHVKRANYQAFILKRALEINPKFPIVMGMAGKLLMGN